MMFQQRYYSKCAGAAHLVNCTSFVLFGPIFWDYLLHSAKPTWSEEIKSVSVNAKVWRRGGGQNKHICHNCQPSSGANGHCGGHTNSVQLHRP